jgi:hypothetical protein
MVMNKYVDKIDELLKSIGFKVDQGRCGSRGEYFITSYIPRVAFARKGWDGCVELHTDMGGQKTTYELRGDVRTPDGVVHNFKLTGVDRDKFLDKLKKEFQKNKISFKDSEAKKKG